MKKIKPTLPRGNRDFEGEVLSKRKYILKTIERHFQSYGFCAIETSSMEKIEILSGKYGDEGEQLMYKILNSGNFLKSIDVEEMKNFNYKKWILHMVEKGLRYDLTVPFARFASMNRHKITLPYKRYQMQPVWRADRPQQGRYREFLQCDADVIGSDALWNEIELVSLILDVMDSLKIREYSIHVNHRGILFDFAKFIGLDSKFVEFSTELDKLDKIGDKQVIKNLLDIGAQENTLRQFMGLFDLESNEEAIRQMLPMTEDKKNLADLTTFLETIRELRAKDIVKIKIDPSLARGLTYYTGMVFEVKPKNKIVGTICAGGRYDNLTQMFGWEGISGVGISFGLDRIYDLMENEALFSENKNQRLSLFLAFFNKKNQKHAQFLCLKLRKEAISVDVYPKVVKLKKQMDYANKINTKYMIVIGDQEEENESYALKDMKTGMFTQLNEEELIYFFKTIK